MNRALVTGGAGFIGSHLTQRLLKDKWKVTVIDDLSEGKWENLPKNVNLTKHKVSILDNYVQKFVKGQDVIFHLAALPRLKRSLDDPWQTHQVNIDGTLKLLLLARDNKIKKFVFSSSSSVYGDNKTPFVETMLPNPIVPYSLHKVVGEQYCRMFSKLWNLPTISLRYFNVYGTKMNPDSPYANLLPKFIKIMSQNKIPTINGDGDQSRDFTYIDDVVDANILAAESSLSGEIINIGFGKSISVNNVVKTLNKLMGKNIKPKHGPAAIEARKTLAANQKAAKLLGWKPKVNFEEGLQKMLLNGDAANLEAKKREPRSLDRQNLYPQN